MTNRSLEERVAALEQTVEQIVGFNTGLTVEQMFSFFNEHVVGTKEFRNFLAEKDATFAGVRDSSVDDEIDRNARAMEAARENLTSGGLSMVGKDGEIIQP